ncbi:MAG: [protein-PII] uridylyltransferase, partial [Pseudomonadota bacterium]
LSQDGTPTPLNEQFVDQNGYLRAVDDDVFIRNPSALLEMFLCLQEHPDLRGVSAHTISLVRRNLHLIDEQFRQHPRNHRVFLAILSAEHGVTRELRRMNRYGVLGLYIPAFGRIVGRMQYDLFHAYTVDAHTLFLVSNLRRFMLNPKDEFPHCTTVIRQLDRPALAYLAGLFHDIAKGRGGDHSELGAVDALAFCREHGLTDKDSELVAWLVANHLVLSMTAQKKDISDPDVIAAFAKRMVDRRHLDYLYVLTAADVRATDPKLWNSWKPKLFRDLYESTRDLLERGVDNALEKPTLVEHTQRDARELLTTDVATDQIERVWSILSEDYFLRHSANEVAWHTRALIENGLESPCLIVASRPELNALAIALYTPIMNHTFAAVTARLTEMALSVLDARIEPTRNAHSLDTYIVVEEGGATLGDTRAGDVRARLADVVAPEDNIEYTVNRRMPRRLRMFDTQTAIQFRPDEQSRHTVMELTSADHPGLLMNVGQGLIDSKVYIKAAKIVTIGERAEDVFYLTDTEDQPLTREQAEQLRLALLQRLDEESV